jgi:5'-deoxynucleotidase YfbR-like HD superfamily hydrolase
VLLAHFVPKIYEFTGQAAVDVAGAALLHDAPETYLQDIISSEKDKLYFKLRGEFIPYKLIERKAQEVVFDRFNVPIEYLAYVEPWDKAICANEKLALQPAADLLPISLYMTPIVPWTPEYARKQFLQMFYALNLDPYERKH